LRPELETYYQIDKFLQGELKGDELVAFQNKMMADESFSEEVKYQKMVNEIVIGASYNSLRNQMSRDISNIDKNTGLKNWGIAAITGIALLSGSIYYSATKQDQSITKPDFENAKQTINTENKISSETKNIRTEEISSEKNTNKPSALTINNQTSNSAFKEDNNAINSSGPNFDYSHNTDFTNTTGTKNNTESQANTVTDKLNTTNTITDLCKNVVIKASIETLPSCINEDKGSILINKNSITGGTEPYKLSKDGNEIVNAFSYNNLSSGIHTITISDALNCQQTFRVEVKEQMCRKNKFVFSPENGETWKYQGNDLESYYMIILNQGGQQVYKSQLTQGMTEWNGIGGQGEYMDAGLYIYIIEYSNGTKENGQVTIIR